MMLARPSPIAQQVTAGVGMKPQFTGAKPPSSIARQQARMMRGVEGRRSPAIATRSPGRTSPRSRR
jgi:hypothetical protein